MFARPGPVSTDPMPAPLPPGCRLVVFDLDGTLYRQGPLRRRMALRLALHALSRGSLGDLRALSRFRALREALADRPGDFAAFAAAGPAAADAAGEAGDGGFEATLLRRLAAETGRSPAELRRLVSLWIEERPLPLLRRSIVPGAAALFAALRRRGIAIGVWSDYPARDKLASLGLAADHVVYAGDPGIGRLKPDPGGLAVLLERAGCPPAKALMVGDRDERDGAAARALGVPFLLRSDRSAAGHSVRDFSALAAALGHRG